MSYLIVSLANTATYVFSLQLEKKLSICSALEDEAI